MKKILTLSLIALFVISSSTIARTTYNKDNSIRVSGTIRAQQKMRREIIAEKREIKRQAAAAAKLNIPKETTKYTTVVTEEE